MKNFLIGVFSALILIVCLVLATLGWFGYHMKDDFQIYMEEQ